MIMHNAYQFSFHSKEIYSRQKGEFLCFPRIYNKIVINFTEKGRLHVCLLNRMAGSGERGGGKAMISNNIDNGPPGTWFRN
jgi:hypothetical protein